MSKAREALAATEMHLTEHLQVIGPLASADGRTEQLLIAVRAALAEPEAAPAAQTEPVAWRLREALREIAEQDPVESALDPQWASRIARAALAAPSPKPSQAGPVQEEGLRKALAAWDENCYMERAIWLADAVRAFLASSEGQQPGGAK